MKKSTLLAFVLGGLLATGVALADKPEQKQAHMQDALKHLEQADGALKKATGDKGGHRQKAMDLIKQATDEVNAGIAFDAANDTPKEGKDGKDKKPK
jgi:hypothetical protein